MKNETLKKRLEEIRIKERALIRALMPFAKAYARSMHGIGANPGFYIRISTWRNAFRIIQDEMEARKGKTLNGQHYGAVFKEIANAGNIDQYRRLKKAISKASTPS
jgi:hypothetical protein